MDQHVRQNYTHNHVTWLASANYRINPTTFAYVKAATGYISGGELGGIQYNPETALEYETGLKIDAFNRTLRTNLALYDTHYRGLQQVTFLTSTFTTAILNVANARADGAELELTWLPPFVRGLQFTGSTSFADFSYIDISPQYLAINAITPEQVLKPQRPRWTSDASVQYTRNDVILGAGLLARVDANYRSSEDLAEFWYTPLAQEYQRSPERTIVNARLALTQIPIDRSRAEVALWVRNLTNEDEPVSGGNIGALVGTFEQARTFGIDVNFDF